MIKTEVENIILTILKSYNPEKIGIFGSFARNENNTGSDLDILVKFKDTLSLFEIIKLENMLSASIGIKVDLVTDGAIKNKRIRENIEKDLKIIYYA
jgi:uncharacterized protein